MVIMNDLDPQAFDLAKAIKRAETGSSSDPYNARGKSGEYGAYQFMPDTYRALAKKYIGDENAPPTVENQNKIAYSEIKSLKDAGYTPAQIASIWNSGDAEAYKEGRKGVNSQGAEYDVPSYVAKVSEAYRELSGVAPASQATSAPESQITSVPESQETHTPEKNIFEKVSEATGFGKTVDTLGTLIVRATDKNARQFIEAPTGKEVAGAALNVGSLAIPTGAGARAATGLVGRVVAPKAAGLVGRSAAGAAAGLGADAARDLEEGREVRPGAGTAIGGLVPLVGPALGRIAGESSGILTGSGYGTLKRGFEAAREGGEVGDAFRHALRGKVEPEAIVDDARNALGEIVGRRNEEYEQLLSSMKGSHQQLDVSPIFNEFKKQLSRFGVSGNPQELDFSRSVFRFNNRAKEDIQTVAREMADFGLKEGDRTPVGVDRLKRSFANLYGDNRDSRALVEAMRKKTRETLSNVPGYDKSMAIYSDMTDSIDDIRKGLSLGDKAATDTAFKKLTSALRQNQEFRKVLIGELDKETGGTLSAKIAGQQLSEFAPRGLMRAVVGGGTLTAIATGMLPALLLLIKTSPRIAGEIAQVLGKTARSREAIEDALIKATSRGAGGLQDNQ